MNDKADVVKWLYDLFKSDYEVLDEGAYCGDLWANGELTIDGDINISVLADRVIERFK